jgi:electron transport complex protein RnfB
MSNSPNTPETPQSGDANANRRDFLSLGVRGLMGLGVAGGLASLAGAKEAESETVWQIDPDKCTQCGNCATACVIQPSAVRCLHSYAICGYCELCGGYHHADAKDLDTAAENLLCPTDALVRTFVEDPYYEYSVDEELCIGCAICVKGCTDFGNGSLYLQIQQDLCVNCNECAIARVCEGDAIHRQPVSKPYNLKEVAE